MNPLEQAQFRRIGALDPVAEAVETQSAQIPQIVRRNRSRVGFERDFGSRGNLKSPVNGLENGVKLGRSQQRRRAAAEENRPNREPAGGARSNQLDFSTQRLNIGRDGLRLPGVGVKVAVGAAVSAKREVKVKRIRHIGYDTICKLKPTFQIS